MGLPTTLDPTADFGLPYTDYAPQANPETDLLAEKYENLCIAVAAMTHTAPRAWVVVSGAAAAGTGSSMVVDHAAMWGDTSSVRPAVVRSATGAYTITWASSYADLNPTTARQVTAAVSLRTAKLQAHEAGKGFVTVSGNVATVTTYTTAGTASNLKHTVWVY